MQWINPIYEDTQIVEKLQKECAANTPFPHIILPNILTDEAFGALQDAIANETFHAKESDLFTFYQSADLKTAEQDVIKELHNAFSSAKTHQLINTLTNTKTSGSISGFVSVYTDTHYLLPHDDQLESRKVAFILYCSTLTDTQGGHLDLFASKDKKPTKVIRSITPVANTLVLFEVTELSWHQVREVLSATRIAIGGWFHG